MHLPAGLLTPITESNEKKPFGVDRNHGDPGGLGDLSLVLVTCLPDNKNGCAGNTPILDMRRAIIRLRLRFPHGCLANTGPMSVTATRLVLWVQAEDARLGKNVNLAAIGTPLDAHCDSTEWQTVEIKPRFNDWACLGARVSSVDRYTCNPAAQVLSSVNIGMGLIFFPVDREVVPQGVLEIDSIEILRTLDNQEQIYDNRYKKGQYAPG